MFVFLGTALLSFGLAWRVPRASTVWIAGLAWPLADWLGLLPGVTHPRALLLIPAALCALGAFCGAGLRRSRDAARSATAYAPVC